MLAYSYGVTERIKRLSVDIGIVRGDIVGLKESAVSLVRIVTFHRFIRTVLLQLTVAPHIPVG